MQQLPCNLGPQCHACCLITFTLAWPDLVQPDAWPHLPAAQISKLPCHTCPLPCLAQQGGVGVWEGLALQPAHLHPTSPVPCTKLG
ncbi:hypothetical protein V8C86DRAFT_2570746 [Haematococcus lacustris]